MRGRVRVANLGDTVWLRGGEEPGRVRLGIQLMTPERALVELNFARAVLPHDRVIDDPATLEPYAYDASFWSLRMQRRPDVVVVPETTADVAATLAIALVEGDVTGPLRRMFPVELVVRDSTAAAPGRASQPARVRASAANAA